MNVELGPAYNVMVGQYRVPFTLGNATGMTRLPFHERSLVARTHPLRDIGATVWGESRRTGVAYYVGLFQGDGESRPGIDARGDLMGRITWQPWHRRETAVEKWQIGLSGRVGERDARRVAYDLGFPSSQQGYRFWRPSYTDSRGQRLRVIPADDQTAVAGELWLPVDRVEVRWEVLGARHETREQVEGFLLDGAQRAGAMHSFAVSALLGVTLWGDPDLSGRPGTGVRAPRVHLDRPERDAAPREKLELTLRGELLRANYESATRYGAPDAAGLDGRIDVASLGIGLNYWVGGHVRISGNWLLYATPDAGSPENRARVPGLEAEPPAADAEVLHELGLRVGAWL